MVFGSCKLARISKWETAGSTRNGRERVEAARQVDPARVISVRVKDRPSWSYSRSASMKSTSSRKSLAR